MPDEHREILEAYAAGVNAHLARKRLPAEFRLLGLTPEPWTPLDTLGIGRLMIFNLSTSWAAELVRAQLIETVGADRLIFGTDSPMLVALKQRGLDLIDQIGLNAADKAKVLGGTAKMLLKL